MGTSSGNSVFKVTGALREAYGFFMTYDRKLAELFLRNFNEAYRSVKLLMSSYSRVGSLMPLKGAELNFLSEEELPDSDLDILNKIEKRGIIRTFEEWKLLKYIRGLFSPDYSKTEEEGRG